MDEGQEAALHFVEEVAVMFEQSALPRMAGRILGWLLLCDPPHQSMHELAVTLQASKGSISTMTRLLEQLGLIERLSLPGERRDYFRIRPGLWHEMMHERLKQLTLFRELAERGLALLAEEPPARRQRLEEMRDLYAFFEQELPALLQRWEPPAVPPSSAP